MNYFYTLLLALILIPNFMSAQGNLVPNWSFEDTTHCPVFADTSLCVGWYSCGLTPDYYNSCANTLQSSFGVPSNWMGYQLPLDGVAYIGILTFGTGGAATIREFAGAKLAQALIPGTVYYVSGYISRASLNSSTCNSNKFGFRFFTQPHNYLNNPPVDNFAQVYSDVVVTDTTNWVKMQGSFVADSAYEYMILGNFFDDVQTTITGCNTSQSVGAYYYIDKICVSTDSTTCEVITAASPYHSRNFISVSPNPAQDFIKINSPALIGAYDLSILDMQGREVFSKRNITASQELLDIRQLKKGLLLIKISYNNQFYFSKFLKH